MSLLLAAALLLAEPRVVVATRHLPPFVIHEADGTWSGISIELWRDVARDAGLEYDLVDAGTLAAMLDRVEKHEADIAVGAITMTPDREARFDFSHAFYSTGLAIAVQPERRSGWLGVTQRLFTWEIFRVLIALSLLLCVFGFVLWLLERKRNPQFGGKPLEGIGSGFWWSAVTMTTVGYGDKVPITALGRIIGLVWMYAAVVIVSLFTAVVTSALTVSQLESRVQGPEDLPKLAVGATAGTGEDYMKRKRLEYRSFATVDEGMTAVSHGEIDAFVFDAPVLRHLVHTRFEELTVVPRTFERQDYGFAMPEGSALRERVNRSLIKRVRDPSWQDVIYRYLGADE